MDEETGLEEDRDGLLFFLFFCSMVNGKWTALGGLSGMQLQCHLPCQRSSLDLVCHVCRT